MKLSSAFIKNKKVILMTSFLLSMSMNAFAYTQIREKYVLDNGGVFFVDPTDSADKTTTVDYFVAQCDHSEISDSKDAKAKGTTTHLVTLTLTPCERTELRGVKAHPVAGDMVADTFDGVVKFNLETKGSDQITQGSLYQVGSSSTMVIGQETISISPIDGSSQNLQKLAQELSEAQNKIEKLKATCEAVKKLKITQALSGNEGKADEIISSLSAAGEGHMRMQPALEQNAGKCLRNFSGKVILNEGINQ